MDDKVKQELYSRLDNIGISIDEVMTYEQLTYFMQGYEYCRMQMMNIIDDTYRHTNKSE